MRKTALASLALSALATSFVAPASEASPPGTPGPDGRKCSYSASSDPAPDADANSMTGQVNGGPLSWSEPSYYIHCHIQVDNNTHTGPVAPGGDVHGPSDNGIAIVTAQVLYESPENSQDYLCTSVSWPNLNGPNWLYWHALDVKDPDDPTDDEPAHWTTVITKPCSAATQVSTGPAVKLIDDVTCAQLLLLHHDEDENWGDRHNPPGPNHHDGPNPNQQIYIDAEGDVFINDGDNDTGAGPTITEDDWRDELFWDCPAYVDFTTNPWGPGAEGTAVIDI